MLLLWLVLWMLVMLLLPSLVWCWYTFSSFCYVYLSHVIFNLALNYNLLILFYHTIYFLTLSIFYPIVSSIHLLVLQSSISKCDNFKVFVFSKFKSSQTLEFDDPLLIYSSCLPLFLISWPIAMRYTWDSFFLIFGIPDEPPCYVWQCTMLLKFV